MDRWIVLLVATLAPAAALAQFKCTGADGKVSFQQMPCANTEKVQRLELRDKSARPRPAPLADAQDGTSASSASAKAMSADERIADRMGRDRRVRELEEQITSTEQLIDRRNLQMNAELEALRNQRSLAKNNLAGATWEQSLATEMQAVATKYRAMNDMDVERLKSMRTDLASAKAAAAAP